MIMYVILLCNYVIVFFKTTNFPYFWSPGENFRTSKKIIIIRLPNLSMFRTCPYAMIQWDDGLYVFWSLELLMSEHMIQETMLCVFSVIRNSKLGLSSIQPMGFEPHCKLYRLSASPHCKLYRLSASPHCKLYRLPVYYSYIVHILQWNLVLHVIYFNFCIETAKVFVPKLLFLNFFPIYNIWFFFSL